jgi:colanic acid/amylovoran biosynthesis glycosyltransferase
MASQRPFSLVPGGPVTILHFVVQWLWTTDSFVYGPIKHSRHDTVVASREPAINTALYPHDRILGPNEWGALGTPLENPQASCIDLIHVHHGYGLPDAAPLSDALRVPLVCSFWGYDVTALPVASPDYYDGVIGSVSTAIVPSRYLTGVVAALGFPRRQIVVVPGSVDTAFFLPTVVPREPRVAFVGRFVEKKGIPLLLGIWDEVRWHVPAAELHLLGYGDAAPTSDERRNIHVHIADPAKGRRQVRDLIAASRVYVAPSQTAENGDAESAHIGNLEAQASGRPVLTTDHGGIPEFVERDRTAIVVPENDPAALCSAMIRLLEGNWSGI